MHYYRLYIIKIWKLKRTIREKYLNPVSYPSRVTDTVPLCPANLKKLQKFWKKKEENVIYFEVIYHVMLRCIRSPALVLRSLIPTHAALNAYVLTRGHEHRLYGINIISCTFCWLNMREVIFPMELFAVKYPTFSRGDSTSGKLDDGFLSYLIGRKIIFAFRRELWHGLGEPGPSWFSDNLVVMSQYCFLVICRFWILIYENLAWIVCPSFFWHRKNSENQASNEKGKS